MEDDRYKISQELNSLKSNPEISELMKLAGMFSSEMQTTELSHIRKYIEMNKKKIPNFSNLTSAIEYLITLGVDQ